MKVREKCLKSFLEFRECKSYICRDNCWRLHGYQPPHKYVDEVHVEGSVARYLLHGHEIARLYHDDRGDLVLKLDTCRYHTFLTASVLNAILRIAYIEHLRIGMRKYWKYKYRGGKVNYLYITISRDECDVHYIFEEPIYINLNTGEVNVNGNKSVIFKWQVRGLFKLLRVCDAIVKDDLLLFKKGNKYYVYNYRLNILYRRRTEYIDIIDGMGECDDYMEVDEEEKERVKPLINDLMNKATPYEKALMLYKMITY